MGIRVKNLHNVVLSLRAPGALTAATDKDVALAPFDGYISNITAKCGTWGTGSTNTICDIHKNGTTIFSAATKITGAPLTGTVTYSALTSQPTELAAGDVLTLDVDSVGTAMKNLEVLITLSRTRVDECSNLADHDSIL